MTVEEVIKILEYPVYKWSLEWDDRDDGLSYCDAIQMAIDALKAQQAVEDNPPLTLEELREIYGEPVFLNGGRGWRICYGVSDFGEEGPYMEVGYGVRVPLFDYGKTCLAYRRKPEEGTK